jgi:hypothetical protein
MFCINSLYLSRVGILADGNKIRELTLDLRPSANLQYFDEALSTLSDFGKGLQVQVPGAAIQRLTIFG